MQGCTRVDSRGMDLGPLEERLQWMSTQREVNNSSVEIHSFQYLSLHPPFLPSVPPVIVNPVQLLVTVLYNEPLDLTCSIESGEATIWWVTPDNDIITDPHLHLDPPYSHGSYMCIAQNDDGADAVSVFVNIEGE